MNVSRLLAVLATIVFGAAFVVLILVKGVELKTVEEMLFLGLALFAGAHCIP